MVGLRLVAGLRLTMVGPGPGGGGGLEVAGLMAGLGGGLVMAGAGFGELGLALDVGALEGSGVTAAPAGDGPATTRTAKGTRKAGVTCDGDAALLLPP
jgi:hypothetical protein